MTAMFTEHDAAPTTGPARTGADRRAVDAARTPTAEAAQGPAQGMAQGPAPDDGAARGGYVLAEATGGPPEAVLVAAGGEDAVALEVRRILQREGTPTRVVSMPCPERFAEQDEEYRESVLPAAVARVSVETGTTLGWYALLGGVGEAVGVDRFTPGAPYRRLYEQSGLTPERVAAAVRGSLARAARAAHAAHGAGR